jgi:hypothetical protein
VTTASATHSVVFDHSACNHAGPETEDDDHDCQPDATWTCHAAPGDYCVFGCEEMPCAETGWSKGDVPGECSYGHKLTPHKCWVVVWLDMLDLQDSHAGGMDLPPLFVYRDGLVDIVEWDEDYLLWDYAEVTGGETVQG